MGGEICDRLSSLAPFLKSSSVALPLVVHLPLCVWFYVLRMCTSFIFQFDIAWFPPSILSGYFLAFFTSLLVFCPLLLSGRRKPDSKPLGIVEERGVKFSLLVTPATLHSRGG